MEPPVETTPVETPVEPCLVSKCSISRRTMFINAAVLACDPSPLPGEFIPLPWLLNTIENLIAPLQKSTKGSLGNPRKTYILIYFSEFLVYFWDFWSNIKVFGQNNVIFVFLQQKPCRINYKFRQKPNLEPKTCKIRPKVRNRTCPDLPRPVQEDKYLLQTSGNIFILSDFTLFNFLLANL